MFFFFNDTATTEIYTLSLHDALPICRRPHRRGAVHRRAARRARGPAPRSEEHTSELQSLAYLVCRLLLEKKKLIHHIRPSAIDLEDLDLHSFSLSLRSDHVRTCRLHL